MNFTQQAIFEKRLAEEFEHLLYKVFKQYFLLDESIEISIRKNYEFKSELIRVKTKLQDFFNGDIPKPRNSKEMCNSYKESFYIHFHTPKQHVAEIRISGHYADDDNNAIVRAAIDVRKINLNKYNYLYVDYSKYINKENYKKYIDLVRRDAKHPVDYVYINQMPNTSNRILVMIIMNTILKYLTNNNLVQANINGLEITWTVSKI